MTSIKHAKRLRFSDMDRVFIRESRPQWARDLEFNICAIARNQGMIVDRQWKWFNQILDSDNNNKQSPFEKHL